MKFKYNQSKPIALVDCNNFYVSCERLFNPVLRNKPVIVLSNNDGCVIARSNEAKLLGIKMGEPFFKCKKIVQDHRVAVFSSNFALYGDLSKRVMAVLKRFTPNLEVYSVDEAFLDLSHIEVDCLEDYAMEIKETVYREIGVPITVSVAETKTLCKVNSYLQKEFLKKCDSLYFKDPSMDHRKAPKVLNVPGVSMSIFGIKKFDREEILKLVKVEEVWGIGRKYAEFLRSKNVVTAYDFSVLDMDFVRKKMTVCGVRTQNELKAIACIEMELDIQSKKTIISSKSFAKDEMELSVLEEALANYIARACEKLRGQKSVCNTVGVFVRTNPFKSEKPYYGNSVVLNLDFASDSTLKILKVAKKALKEIYISGLSYKKVGCYLGGISSRVKEFKQSDLFEGDKFENAKSFDSKLMEVWDLINAKHGKDKVVSLAMGFNKKWQTQRSLKSNAFTTCWDSLLKVKI